MSRLILRGAVGVAAVFSSLNRCGAAPGSPSSLQHSPSQAFHTCLSSAGPLSKKSERGISSAKHLLDILQCPPKIKLQSRASVNPTCLISSRSFFLIPSLTPKQTSFSSEALGSTHHLVVKLLPDFLTPTFLKYLYAYNVCKFLHTLMQTLKAFRCCSCLIFIVHHLILLLGLQKSSLAWRTVAQEATSGRAVICLLKPQRPDMGTTDSQVSHFMFGEHFDILVEHLQCHFVIAVEVTIFLSALTDTLKGVYLLGSGSVCQGCRLLNCIHLLSSFAFHSVTLRHPGEKFCTIPAVPGFPIRKYLGVIFQFRTAAPSHTEI